MAVGRPVLIISNNERNEKSKLLVVAYMSTSPKNMGGSLVRVVTKNRYSHVICNQIQSIDKDRLTDYMCTISDSELKRVDSALRMELDLCNEDDDVEDVDSVKMELEILKKQYEKALEKIADLRFEKDVAVVPKAEEPPKMEEPQLDISGLAEKFKVYDERQKKNKVEPVSGKVNVNTADWRTLVEKVGMAEQTAKQLVAYRNKNGAFVLVTDLLKLPRITQKMFDRYFDLIEV
jgi:mRNA-degrading endonuclease toxin of MazEF toxin-antitoxin module